MLYFYIDCEHRLHINEDSIKLQFQDNIIQTIELSKPEFYLIIAISENGSVDSPLSKRKLENILLNEYSVSLAENGLKNLVASIRKKIRFLLSFIDKEDLVVLKNIHRVGFFLNLQSVEKQEVINEINDCMKETLNLKKADVISFFIKNFFSLKQWLLLLILSILFYSLYTLNEVHKTNNEISLYNNLFSSLGIIEKGTFNSDKDQSNKGNTELNVIVSEAIKKSLVLHNISTIHLGQHIISSENSPLFKIPLKYNNNTYYISHSIEDIAVIFSILIFLVYGHFLILSIFYVSQINNIVLYYKPVYDRSINQYCFFSVHALMKNSICSSRLFLRATTCIMVIKSLKKCKHCLPNQLMIPIDIELLANRCYYNLLKKELGRLESDYIIIKISNHRNFTYDNTLIVKIQAIHELGFKLCLEDLSEGNHTISLVYKLKPEFSTISKKLVYSIYQQKDREELIKAIISISKLLNCKIIGDELDQNSLTVNLKDLGVNLLHEENHYLT